MRARAPGPPDRDARFRALFDDAYGDVLRFVRRRSDPRHGDLAEDVVAETFLVAWRRLDEAPAAPGALRPWLFGVARHCLLNARRGEDRRQALAVRVADAPAGRHVDDVPARVDLAAAWRTLRPAEQEVLALTVFEDLTSVEAARVLGTTATGYRLRLMRARRALRAALDPVDPTPTALEATP